MNRRPTAPRHGVRARMLLATALFCAMPLLASAAPPIAKPLLPSMGEQRSFNLRIGPASLGRTFVIRSADASFVKVHFDHVSLPDGVTLEVSNPAGTEVYRYSNQKRDGYTYDVSLGHDGRSSFSAMSIHGPVALVRLVGTPRGAWRATDGVRVSRFMRGHSERKMQELRSASQRGLLPASIWVYGTAEQRPVACYQTSDPVAFERTRPVAHLMPIGCTAWRVGPGNHMFTNNHCISTAADTAASELWFNNQASTCTGTTATPTKVPADQMLKTDRTLDYTLFTLKNPSAAASFGYLGLETRAPTLNEEIFIAGHPNWRLKELSVVSDQDGGGRCRINNASTNGYGTNTDIGYYCDTEGGNSGSPVVARASNKVIALHHLGGSINKGVKISQIWPQVSSFFGGVVPNGDNGTITPPPPGDTVVHNVNLPSVSTGNWSSIYTVAIPAGTTKLVVNISGGTGDADLYVRAGAAPTTTLHNCRPYLPGNTETCTINNPVAGTTYYIGVRAYSSFSGVNMKATRSP